MESRAEEKGCSSQQKTERVNHYFDIKHAENAEKLKVMLIDKQQFSVRNIAPLLTLSPTTVWRILRYDTKANFYRPSTIQPLTEDHKEQRKIFCNWLLQQPDDFVQQVVWTDEKIFVHNQRPNRKNDGT